MFDSVFRLYSETGGRQVTVRDLVGASRVPSSVIYHGFGDIGTLYRMAVCERIRSLAGRLEPSCGPAERLAAVLLDHARRVADLFESEDYRRLLFLVIRDGPAHPWLVRRHEQDLIGAAEAALERSVAAVRTAPDGRLQIRASAKRAFVRRLQAELALPMMVPGRRQRTRQEVRMLTESIAAEAQSAVYCAGAMVRAIEQLTAPPQPRRAAAAPARRPFPPPPAGEGMRHAAEA